MKYTLVYREHAQGYNWSVMNTDGLYAAAMWNNGDVNIRSWRFASSADEYMQVYRHRNPPGDLVWAPWPTEKPTPIKPVTTAASYKPACTGYPDSAPRCAGHESDRMAAGWSSMGAVTGRMSGKSPSFVEVRKQPLVWPVLPQHDDGSNEEATTVPEIMVRELGKRVSLIRRRNNLKRY